MQKSRQGLLRDDIANRPQIMGAPAQWAPSSQRAASAPLLGPLPPFTAQANAITPAFTTVTTCPLSSPGRRGAPRRMWRLWELYDLEVDPGEPDDLAEREPGVLERLVDHWEKYSAETGMVQTPGFAVTKAYAALTALHFLS